MKKIISLFTVIVIAAITNAQTKSIIYFDSAKPDLKDGSKKILDSLIFVLKPLTSYQITINAYCDNSGTVEGNQILSEQRANAISDYFINQKLDSAFITKKGFAAKFPVASNDNDSGKAKNRRAEIILLIPADQRDTPSNLPLVDNKPKDTISIPTNSDGILENKIEEPVVGNFDDKSNSKNFKVGRTLRLKNLNFVNASPVLLSTAKPTLERLLKLMKENPTLEILIGGHVCCFNDMRLSVLRAKTIYDYLVENGIDKSRMKYKGYGLSKPLYLDDLTNEKHAKANRRVEITILKM